MKALLCAKCHDIRALDPTGAWTTCRCGRVSARWIDPHRGTVSVRAAEQDRAYPRILGLNNAFLVPALEGPSHAEMVKAGGQWEAWRRRHADATNAPGYIFDKDKRACWACIIRVGETSDVSWEPDPEPAPEGAPT